MYLDGGMGGGGWLLTSFFSIIYILGLVCYKHTIHVEGFEYKRRVCKNSCAGVVKTLVIKTLVQHVGTPTQVPVILSYSTEQIFT